MKLTPEERNEIRAIANEHGYSGIHGDGDRTVYALLDHIAELERERDEAVAGAYKVAARVADQYYKQLSTNGVTFEQCGIAQDIRDDIRALTPADATRAAQLLVASAVAKEANDWNVHAVNVPAAASYEWRRDRLAHNKAEVARLTAEAGGK